jgi:hypothetical protein
MYLVVVGTHDRTGVEHAFPRSVAVNGVLVPFVFAGVHDRIGNLPSQEELLSYP